MQIVELRDAEEGPRALAANLRQTHGQRPKGSLFAVQTVLLAQGDLIHALEQRLCWELGGFVGIRLRPLAHLGSLVANASLLRGSWCGHAWLAAALLGYLLDRGDRAHAYRDLGLGDDPSPKALAEGAQRLARLFLRYCEAGHLPRSRWQRAWWQEIWGTGGLEDQAEARGTGYGRKALLRAAAQADVGAIHVFPWVPEAVFPGELLRLLGRNNAVLAYQFPASPRAVVRVFQGGEADAQADAAGALLWEEVGQGTRLDDLALVCPQGKGRLQRLASAFIPWSPLGVWSPRSWRLDPFAASWLRALASLAGEWERPRGLDLFVHPWTQRGPRERWEAAAVHLGIHRGRTQGAYAGTHVERALGSWEAGLTRLVLGQFVGEEVISWKGEEVLGAGELPVDTYEFYLCASSLLGDTEALLGAELGAQAWCELLGAWTQAYFPLAGEAGGRLLQAVRRTLAPFGERVLCFPLVLELLRPIGQTELPRGRERRPEEVPVYPLQEGLCLPWKRVCVLEYRDPPAPARDVLDELPAPLPAPSPLGALLASCHQADIFVQGELPSVLQSYPGAISVHQLPAPRYRRPGDTFYAPALAERQVYATGAKPTVPLPSPAPPPREVTVRQLAQFLLCPLGGRASAALGSNPLGDPPQGEPKELPRRIASRVLQEVLCTGGACPMALERAYWKAMGPLELAGVAPTGGFLGIDSLAHLGILRSWADSALALGAQGLPRTLTLGQDLPELTCGPLRVVGPLGVLWERPGGWAVVTPRLRKEASPTDFIPSFLTGVCLVATGHCAGGFFLWNLLGRPLAPAQERVYQGITQEAAHAYLEDLAQAFVSDQGGYALPACGLLALEEDGNLTPEALAEYLARFEGTSSDNGPLPRGYWEPLPPNFPLAQVFRQRFGLYTQARASEGAP